MRRVIAVLGVLASVAAASAADDWPMLVCDVRRRGATAEEIRPPLRRAWLRYVHFEGLMPSVQPVVAGGRLYFGTLSGSFYCLDAATGKDVWKARVGWPVFHTACVSPGGVVVFGAGDGKVRALRLADGRAAWEYATGAPLWNAPLPHGGRIYVGGRDGVFYCLGAADGECVWRYDAGAPICQSPALDPDAGSVCFTSEDMVVHALDAATGKRRWRSARLHGVSARSFHPVVAPDGTVMVATIPFYSWSRAHEPLRKVEAELFGTEKLEAPDTKYPGKTYVRLPNWRFSRECNERMRRHAEGIFLRPGYFERLTAALTRAVEADPASQCLFLLDGGTGRQRFILPVLYSAFAKSAPPPPVVAPSGKVITKWYALLPSRFGGYQREVNAACVDTWTGRLSPLFDESRVGSGMALGLIGDESCQMTVAGRRLINLAIHHGEELRHFPLGGGGGRAGGLLYSTGLHWYGVGVIHRVLRGEVDRIAPGQEDMTRGFGVGNPGEHATGNHTAANMPVVVAGGKLFWMAAGKLMAFEPAEKPAKITRSEKIADYGIAPLTGEELKRLYETWPINWDYVDVKPPGGWGNHKVHTPDRIRPVEGTRRNPRKDAARRADAVTDAVLDKYIWEAPALGEPAAGPAAARLRERLAAAVAELIARPRWMPFRFQGGKHPSDYLEFYVDPAETVEALALALPHLPPDLRERTKAYVNAEWVRSNPILMNKGYPTGQGEPREGYRVPDARGRVFRLSRRRGVERACAAWLWGRHSGRWDLVKPLWPTLRAAHAYRRTEVERDAGNNHCSALIAACRMARRFGDNEALKANLAAARAALRRRLAFALAYDTGNVANRQPALGLWRSYTRWTYLTPEVARLVRERAPAAAGLVATYVDRLRPYWYLTWGPLTPASNESSTQLPHNTLTAFLAKAYIQRDRPERLAVYCDVPACRGDPHYIHKLAVTLTAMSSAAWRDVR